MIDRESDPGAWAREIAARGLRVPTVDSRNEIAIALATLRTEMQLWICRVDRLLQELNTKGDTK